MKHIRRILSAVLPVPLANRWRDFRDRVRLFVAHYAGQKELDDRPAWRNIVSAMRVLFHPAGTVLFFPERPTAPYAAYTLCTWLGYSIVKDPSRRFDIAFKRANRTFFDPAALDPVPVARDRIVNAGSVDVSKSKVGRVFAEVFGYPLDVNPLDYEGGMVEKSDINATHNGRVVQGPLAPDQVKEGSVYEKLIDNLSGRPGFVMDYRLPVYGNEIPLAYLKYRDINDRFDNYTDVAMLEVDEVFSPEEVEKIVRFCRKMGTEYCELDVLKDSDGRVYIVDINNTPRAAGVRLLPKGTRRKALERMAASFDRLLESFALNSGR